MILFGCLYATIGVLAAGAIHGFRGHDKFGNSETLAWIAGWPVGIVYVAGGVLGLVAGRTMDRAERKLAEGNSKITGDAAEVVRLRVRLEEAEQELAELRSREAERKIR